MNWQASQVIFVLIVLIIWFTVKWKLKSCKIKESEECKLVYEISYDFLIYHF